MTSHFWFGLNCAVAGAGASRISRMSWGGRRYSLAGAGAGSWAKAMIGTRTTSSDGEPDGQGSNRDVLNAFHGTQYGPAFVFSKGVECDCPGGASQSETRRPKRLIRKLPSHSICLASIRTPHKAAEGCRTPKPGGSTTRRVRREASWTAVHPHRFRVRSMVQDFTIACERACALRPPPQSPCRSFGRATE